MIMIQPTFVDTKTIIVNLLNEDKQTFLSIERLQHLLTFIYMELRAKCKLEEYQISFDINFEALERTVLYNNNIFILDLDDEKIYLREPQSISQLAEEYKIDNTVYEIIKTFNQINAA